MAGWVQVAPVWLRHVVDSNDWTATVVWLCAMLGAWTCLSYPLSLLRLVVRFTPLASPFQTSSLLSLASSDTRDRSSRAKETSKGSEASWAVITGATGGIGKAFCIQLAQAGFNLVVVGRSSSKLDDLVRDIHAARGQRRNIVVKTWVMDLQNATRDDWTSFQHMIEHDVDGRITLLINNAGLSHASPVEFEHTPNDELHDIVAVNIDAVVNVTKSVLPTMLLHSTSTSSRSQRRRAAILNLGSFSALVPTPMLATYAGTKGFLYTWSQALGTELEDKGIAVRLLNTYFVASEMSKIRRATWMIPSPDTYVTSVLHHVTLARAGGGVEHPFVSTPYLAHALVEWVVQHVGSRWYWLKYNLNMQKDIARRVERRKQRLLDKEAAVPS